jgi:hypothetical protein
MTYEDLIRAYLAFWPEVWLWLWRCGVTISPAGLSAARTRRPATKKQSALSSSTSV